MQWASVQVGSNIFQVQDDGQSDQMQCQWVRADGSKSEDVSLMEQPRAGFALANVKDRYVLATCGTVRGAAVDTCHRFETATSTWQALPSLNFARSHHASCSLDGSVYVFCGIGADN